MKPLTIILIVLFPVAMVAQSITGSTLSSGGSFLTVAGGSLSMTVGQPLVGELTFVNHRLHLGFQVGYAPGTVTGVESEIRLSVFPNPVISQLHIRTSTPGEDLSLQLTDLQGRQWKMDYKKDPDGAFIDVMDLPAAMYILRIQDRQGRTRHAAFVKSN